MDLRRGAKRRRQRVNEEIAKRHDEYAHPQRAVEGDVECLHGTFAFPTSQVA